MNPGPPPAEERSPAERRLEEHLDLLRADPPEASAALVAYIVRRARWQRAIRRPLLAVSVLSAAIAEGIRLLLGPRPGDR